MTLMLQIAGGIILVPVILFIALLALCLVAGVGRLLFSRAGLITAISLVGLWAFLMLATNYIGTGSILQSPCGGSTFERC